MAKQMIMGNQAIALGALKAGVNLVAGYPGTPSSEIIEFIAKYKEKTGTYVEWSVNEKAAAEVAGGASFAGSRTLITMKQVGLNVASDPVMCLSYVGVKGGMVIVVADDPGPISSQTEQDTRTYASFSKLPCLDPSTPQEAYEMVQYAFELSEKYNTPVLLRPTTRVDHAYQSFEFPELLPCRAPGTFEKDSSRWVIFPRASYMNHKRIFERNENVLPNEFSQSKWNYIESEKRGGSLPLAPTAEVSTSSTTSVSATPSSGKFQVQTNNVDGNKVNTQFALSRNAQALAFVAGGISWCYLKEAIKILVEENPKLQVLKDAAILKIGTPYPFPKPLAENFLKENPEVIVFEELDPVIEENLISVCGEKNLAVKIHGKKDGLVSEAGELSTDIVKNAILGFVKKRLNESEMLKQVQHDGVVGQHDNVEVRHDEVVGQHDENKCQQGGNEKCKPELPIRPPVLCAGCPHRGAFYAVKQAMKGKKTAFCGDIGCYTLGNAKPLDMCDTCLCMGADITMAQGFYHNEPDRLCFSFIGDSTFFASGITGVVNAVYNQSHQTICILDNSTTAMTGHQPHPGTGMTMMGQVVDKISIPKLLEAIGVNPVIEVDPFNQEASVEAVKAAVAAPGVSAVIFKSACISIASKLGYKMPGAKKVDTEKCIGCRKCINELGCPALSVSVTKNAKGKQLVEIDSSLCTGCGLCSQLCAVDAIK